MQVAGTVSGPVNTGVSVNGAPAHVQDGVFLTPEITFGEDVNTLTAEASTMDALTATATSVVTVSEIPAEARLTADADAGFAPLPVNFHLSLVEGLTVQSVNVDFDGDGIIDYTGTSIGDLPLTTYTQPGIYTATATITLTDDQQIVAERKVIAVDLARQRETVCAVYAHLRASLASQDADQAGTALASHLKTRLMPMFAALGPRMPEVAKNLGILADGVIGLNRAEIISVVDNHTEVRGYPIQFAPDASGVWRIDSM